MAAPYSHFAPTAVIQKSVSNKRSSSIVGMCTGNNMSINKTPHPPSQIRLCPTRNKVVFEDQAKGIVCYSDENGEITCEGFDEGPRFQRQISGFVSNSRYADIIELYRSWFRDVRVGADNGFIS